MHAKQRVWRYSEGVLSPIAPGTDRTINTAAITHGIEETERRQVWLPSLLIRGSTQAIVPRHTRLGSR